MKERETIMDCNIVRPARFAFLSVLFQEVASQSGTVYDLGEGRHGNKRGSFSPGEWQALCFLVMTIVAGLVFSLGLCYYVSKKSRLTTYGRMPSRTAPMAQTAATTSGMMIVRI